MSGNDALEFFVIYELEQTVLALPDKENRRTVVLNHIAFYNTADNAEAAMLSYIKEHKKQVGNKLYYDGCIEYHISERKVFNRPILNQGISIGYRSFTPDGSLKDNKME